MRFTQVHKGVSLIEVIMVSLLVALIALSVHQVLVPSLYRAEVERDLAATRTAIDFAHTILARDLRRSSGATFSTPAGQQVLRIDVPSGTVNYIVTTSSGMLERIDESGNRHVLFREGVQTMSLASTPLYTVNLSILDSTGKTRTISVMASQRR